MNHSALFTLLLSVFIGLLGIGIIIPVLPVFATTLGASGFALGLIMAAFSVSRGLLQPMVGSWSDQWGRKRFLIGGLAIYGSVGLLIPLAESVVTLTWIRFLHGIGSAMIVPVAMAYMSILAPSGQEGRYMSYLNMVVFAGIGCGPMVGGFIADHWGMPMVFYSMAVLSFIAMSLVWLTMPEEIGHEVRQPEKLLPTLIRMWHNHRTLGILLARGVTMLIPIPTMAFLPLLMASWHGEQYSGMAVGVVIACRTLVNAVLQVPFGRLADRFNKRLLLTCGCMGLAVVLVLIPLSRSFSVIMAVYMFLGMMEALIWAVLGAYASLEAKAHYGHGTMMGVYGLAMSIGVFTGGIIAGFSMDFLGIERAYQVVAVIVLVFSLFAFVLIGCEKES